MGVGGGGGGEFKYHVNNHLGTGIEFDHTGSLPLIHIGTY